MRNLEELYRDIDRFTLERHVRQEVTYTKKDIPRLERANAEDFKVFNKKPSTLGSIQAGIQLDARTRLIKMLEKHGHAKQLTDVPVPREKGIDALADFIRTKWTVREIMFFRGFTRGGSFASPNGWSSQHAGYAAKTFEGQNNLERLFDVLANVAWAYLGAHAFHKLAPGDCRSKMIHIIPHDCMDMTIDALVATLPQNLAELIEAAVAKVDSGTQMQLAKGDEILTLLKGKVETTDLVSDLSPETSTDDAAKFAARLVCHVWLTMPGMSKSKATDYVFQRARDGDSLFADCNYARSLVVKYGRNESTVAKDAARLHSRFNSWRKKSKKPYTANIFRMLAKESRAKEEEEHIGKHR